MPGGSRQCILPGVFPVASLRVAAPEERTCNRRRSRMSIAPAPAAGELKDRLRGQIVGSIVSGCNTTLDQLRWVLADPQTR